VVAAVVGDWTMAVSRKERKNRGKRDDASKHKRPVSLIDVSSHKMETPNSSPSPESNTSKKKVCSIYVIVITVAYLVSAMRHSTSNNDIERVRALEICVRELRDHSKSSKMAPLEDRIQVPIAVP